MILNILVHHNEIFNFTPNWFDWLTLLLTIASILGAYFVSESVYKREQKYKKREYKIMMVTKATRVIVKYCK